MSARAPVPVLFMQSQDYFGADSQIHRLIMQHLDRSAFDVHVACTVGDTGDTPASMAALQGVDDLSLRPTRFGPTVNSRSLSGVAWQAVDSGPAAAADLVRLVAYARRHGIRIVHGTEKPRDAFYGHLLSRAIGARSITHLHVKAEGWISPLSRWAMRRNDGLIGVSEFVSGSLIDMGFAEERVHTVHNAIDTQAWRPAVDDGSVRAELALPAHVPLLLTASRLFPWKGQAQLLRALAQVARDGAAFHLLVVGEDDPRATPGGGSFMAELRDMTSALGLDAHVTFTGHRTDVRRLMGACDVFVMPSFEEPFGMVYLEAMASSKPVVALDNGGAREVVVDGRTGLLSEPGDDRGLAANLLSLLGDPRRRERMGRAGRQRALEHFGAARLARDVERVYRVVLDPAGAAEGAERPTAAAAPD